MSEVARDPPGAPLGLPMPFEQWKAHHALETRIALLEKRCTDLEADMRERVHVDDFKPIKQGFWGAIVVLFTAVGGALLATLGLKGLKP